MKYFKYIIGSVFIGLGLFFNSFSYAQIFDDFDEPEQPVIINPNTNSNIIESVNGATVILDDNVLATKVGQPMFFRYGQLLNTAITFFPIIFVVSMFWFVYGVIKNLGKNKGLESSKSLDNK